MDTQVLVVGGGPVGLTLAIDLGRRGIRCVLVEQKEAPQFLPKMERCNARTMEIFRRLGLADKIRAAGLRADVPMDVFIILAMNQPPLVRHHYPSVDEARATIRAHNDGTQPAEPYQLISQYTLEPLLKQEVETLPSVTLRYGCEFLAFEQDAAGVSMRVRTLGGETETLRADYLVGCDGGASAVRKQLGIKLRGEGNLLELRQALFRCDELFDRIPIGNGPGRGRHYHVADGRATFLIMQDSTRHWTLHAVVDRDEDMKAMFERTVGIPMRYEMLACNPWRQNLLLADSYGTGCVFLAGDAVHLVIPTGDTARDNLVRIARVEQPKSNEMIGAELGYRYANSPIICDVPGGPEHLFRDYRPTTWPGARLPHVWLNDGSAIQDRIGGGYT